MSRIISGAAKGRRLVAPPGRSTRPTSDRTREALFGAVIAAIGGLAGAAVLDLYAGSGAVGLEALSRGAADVLMVESDPRAAKTIRDNADAVGLPGAEVICDRVERVLRRGPGSRSPRAFVFADPPYALAGRDVLGMLTALDRRGWLAPDALVVVERDARSGPVEWPQGYVAGQSRRYGETALWYGHAAGAEPAAAGSTTGA